ncbi:DUF3817 domain-containing protein [Arthrobacter mobilis]|uniref:DUF3817 domain-containing protein n=1 Tax=Arthrobacter mobilis TaxID=2724944 RepID=A0A7X6HCG1_9MICC|nr:DUF3817 domain-containing protein [Arthrobacter mobilis]NKX53699.1 DUF3817 domain-containing protein [Arthrobacter mobilis]
MSETAPNQARPAGKRRYGGTHAQIRSALTFYKVASYITGVMLLLLCAEMVLRYGFNLFLFAGGTNTVTGQPFGFGLAQAEPAAVAGGANLSIAVLIAHGWLYVVYLLADFRLWSLMRWPFPRFVLIALGGVIPFLSFFLERRVHRQVEEDLASHPEAAKRY